MTTNFRPSTHSRRPSCCTSRCTRASTAAPRFSCLTRRSALAGTSRSHALAPAQRGAEGTLPRGASIVRRHRHGANGQAQRRAAGAALPRHRSCASAGVSGSWAHAPLTARCVRIGRSPQAGRDSPPRSSFSPEWGDIRPFCGET